MALAADVGAALAVRQTPHFHCFAQASSALFVIAAIVVAAIVAVAKVSVAEVAVVVVAAAAAARHSHLDYYTRA